MPRNLIFKNVSQNEIRNLAIKNGMTPLREAGINKMKAGITTIESTVELGFIEAISNQQIVGQFISGMIPVLWIGLGTISAGILTSNWLNRKLKHISDILRIIVLAAIYPTVAQFATILITNESSFSLIPPLIIGAAITLISATILFRRYRKKGGDQILTE